MFYIQVWQDGQWSLPINIADEETFFSYEAAREYCLLQGENKSNECVADCTPKSKRKYWRLIEQ
jgi:hypothetical protein